MGKNTETPVDKKLVAAEATIMAGPHASRVVPGSIRRADPSNEAEAKYGRKILCDINTIGMDGKPDGLTRTVATSDLFQVRHQPEVAKALRAQANKDKRAKARAEAEAKAPKKPAKGKAKASKAAADLGV